MILYVLRVEPLRRRLVHLPVIPLKLLAFFRCFPEACGMRLVASLAEQLPEEISAVQAIARRHRSVCRDIGRLGIAMDIQNTDQARNACRSLAELQQLHDRWTGRLNRAEREEQEQAEIEGGILDPASGSKTESRFDLGRPPLPGNARIQPILTAGELLEEGRLQSHCVGSYVNSVVNGKCFIYRVVWPERATLEIRLKPTLSIGQCVLANNRAASDSTLRVVRRWFQKQLANATEK